MVPLANMDSSFERLLGKKRKRENNEQPTYSFDINLVPYSEDVFAEYNWKELVEKCKDDDNTHLEINTPFKPKIVRATETPTPKKKKKRRKLDEELEYDIHDPFIDDDEQTDEEIPEDLMTARGGFYINTGNLILIKRPISIFEEDTEEMMDKLDRMDDKDDTEPEDDYEGRKTIDGEDEITLSKFPEKSNSCSSKVEIGQPVVKVKKVKSSVVTDKGTKKVKKLTKKMLKDSKSPLLKLKKKKKTVNGDTKSSNKENIDSSKIISSTPQKVSPTKKENKTSTPKKLSNTPSKEKTITPKKVTTTPNKEKILTPKKTTTPKKEKTTTPKKEKTVTPKKVKATPKKVKEGILKKVKKTPKKENKAKGKGATAVTKIRKKIDPSQMPDTSTYDQKLANMLTKTETQWKCNVCQHEHESKANVLVHLETHIQDIVLSCILCDQTFKMKKNLKQHILKCHVETPPLKGKKKKTGKLETSPKKKVSKVVKKIAKDVKKAKVDKKVVGNKPVTTVQRKKLAPLQLCDTAAFDLKVAELIEKVDDKWKCKACEVSNDLKALVLKHAEQHVEGFTLPCLLCDKTFTMKRNLKQHMYLKHKESSQSSTKDAADVSSEPSKKKKATKESGKKKDKENCENVQSATQEKGKVVKKSTKLNETNVNLILTSASTVSAPQE